MILIKQSADLSRYLLSHKIAQKNTGFVPTMGALHEGHLSLLKHAINNNEVTVCSIFVNPTQFNDPDDFKKYPKTIESDLVALEAAGTNIVFIPGVRDIYPAGINSLPEFDLGNLERVLEGTFRPGHFQGVCQVMSRLLKIVRPGNLYMGQKDYQQCMVVNRLLQIMNDGVILHTVATQREPDGLAMSSRNVRLNPAERIKAASISDALHFIQENAFAMTIEDLRDKAIAMLEAQTFRVDYVEIVHALTLEALTEIEVGQPTVALAAAYMHEVRLIDNMFLPT